MEDVYAVDQFSRPISDTGVDWDVAVGCVMTSKWLCLDEVTPDGDTTYYQTLLISTSNNDIDFMGLSSITDPLKSDGHVLRVQAKEGGLGTNSPFLILDLISAGSTVASFTIPQNTLTTTWTVYEFPLTPTQANAITSYSSLQVRMEASCNTGTCSASSARDVVRVSLVEFAVEDAPIIPPPTLDSVTVVNSTALEINFTAPADLSNILSFDIRKFNGTTFNTVGNVLKSSTLSFVDSGLVSDTFYKYHIVSIGTTDESVPSNELGQRTTVILFSARPDSNPSVRWVNGLGNPPCSDLQTFACVDDYPQIDDSDFIQTIGLGDGDSDLDIMTLSDIEDPLISDSHFLKYTVREAGVGTNPVGFTITLKQGSTTIATFSHPQNSLQTGIFQLFQQELSPVQTDGITDYSDLSVELLGFCTVGCSNSPTDREKVNVSFVALEIEQVTAPLITTIDTLSSSSLRLSWTNEDLDPEISEIIVQRENGTDFIEVGTVPISVFSFDDTGLEEKKVIKYRLLGRLPSGYSKPSPEFSGATPPTSTELNTQGAILEANPTNSFTLIQKQIFSQTTEGFNLNTASIRLIMDDIEINNLNAYQIIDKMKNGVYDSTQKMKNAGAFYGTEYLQYNNLDFFIGNITSDVISALGGSNGLGDNPNHGVRVVGQ